MRGQACQPAGCSGHWLQTPRLLPTTRCLHTFPLPCLLAAPGKLLGWLGTLRRWAPSPMPIGPLSPSGSFSWELPRCRLSGQASVLACLSCRVGLQSSRDDRMKAINGHFSSSGPKSHTSWNWLSPGYSAWAPWCTAPGYK